MWATSTCGGQYCFQRLCLLYAKLPIKLQIKLVRFHVEETIKYNIKKVPSYKGGIEVQNRVITSV